jgi:hypothetical protein
VPHVHDTSSKTLTQAGVKSEQWDPNHQREQQKLDNEGGCKHKQLNVSVDASGPMFSN